MKDQPQNKIVSYDTFYYEKNSKNTWGTLLERQQFSTEDEAYQHGKQLRKQRNQLILVVIVPICISLLVYFYYSGLSFIK